MMMSQYLTRRDETVFKKGEKYYDAVGRRWKVIKVIHQEDYDILLVKRRFRTEIALTEPDYKTAIILFELGFTTIYEDDG